MWNFRNLNPCSTIIDLVWRCWMWILVDYVCCLVLCFGSLPELRVTSTLNRTVSSSPWLLNEVQFVINELNRKIYESIFALQRIVTYIFSSLLDTCKRIVVRFVTVAAFRSVLRMVPYKLTNLIIMSVYWSVLGSLFVQEEFLILLWVLYIDVRSLLAIYTSPCIMLLFCETFRTYYWHWEGTSRS
jgi:hypothetical protein